MYLSSHLFKVKRLWIVLLVLAAAVQPGCKPDIKTSGASLRYFDLKKFISADSARLAKSKVTVVKTVIHNGSHAQTKRVSISNWGRELSLFAQSDINKPAWRQSYLVEVKGDSTIYKARETKLNMRRMVVTQKNGAVTKISILNASSNLLFHSSETLVYIPDSLYIINKQQQVKLLGDNTYMIKGLISEKVD
jgi:hypothetical protein